MKVTLLGLGCGTEATVTREAEAALRNAKMVIGAWRLVAAVPEGWLSADCDRRNAVLTKDVLAAVEQAEGDVCVVMSGDSGFYSNTRVLLPHLKGYETEVLPGISSIQALSAKLGQPWQDWRLRSAHGVDCDVVEEVSHGETVFFLTGGKIDAAGLCRRLAEAGLGALKVTVAENLTAPEERITAGTAEELAKENFAPLSVVLCESAPRYQKRVPGIPDDDFERLPKVPMTKQEVRAVALAKLALRPEDTCWDVGAGTGSVSVEMALQCKAVYAVERLEEALELAKANREKFGAWNLTLLGGAAPDALRALPAPDAVFVGGTGGNMEAILRLIYEKNEKARVCVAAIALESAYQAVQAFTDMGIEPEISQIAVSRGKKAGSLHLMMAQNPIYLISGEGK